MTPVPSFVARLLALRCSMGPLEKIRYRESSLSSLVPHFSLRCSACGSEAPSHHDLADNPLSIHVSLVPLINGDTPPFIFRSSVAASFFLVAGDIPGVLTSPFFESENS